MYRVTGSQVYRYRYTGVQVYRYTGIQGYRSGAHILLGGGAIIQKRTSKLCGGIVLAATTLGSVSHY